MSSIIYHMSYISYFRYHSISCIIYHLSYIIYQPASCGLPMVPAVHTESRNAAMCARIAAWDGHSCSLRQA